uniref:Uncharacterized protein n=1 Tax=Candidatus Kentrum sp. LFY TaxID=2126342 RepID=A0A450UUX3_9GAMM|nr:MAG: hypothetical protein BECKLFY1418A_GA0070994_105721 [Candidatus Kentron sp. LFY]VFK02668.1 MAG: hypothetical protein BECKLFY1418A_GA0070994_12182 [Candidatus Kentron sp. LFY]
MLRVGEQLFQEMIVWVGDIVAQWIYCMDNVSRIRHTTVPILTQGTL